MNLPALNAFLQGRGASAPAGQPHAPSQHPQRAREAAANATPAAASPHPQDARHRPQDARPVLESSDTALTRRDIPRGSIVDIVA